MPPAPDKELPFLVINFWHFPSEDVVRKYEETVRDWWPELHFFVGRITGDVSEKYTHCIIWQYKDFDEYKRNIEEYLPMLEEMSKEAGGDVGFGDYPGYMFDHAYCCRVIDSRDPVLLEHGVDEWTRRLHSVLGKPTVPNPEAEAQWHGTLWEKLARDWGAEALVRSGWLPNKTSASQ
jgi:hypothetical protein